VIVVMMQTACSQPVLMFERATDFAAFVGKHKLHPWEYRRFDPVKPSSDWHRVNPEMTH